MRGSQAIYGLGDDPLRLLCYQRIAGCALIRPILSAKSVERARSSVLIGWEDEVITGAHVIVYTKNAEADREFFRDVLGFRSIDAGQGWLIFALPPSEAAFHPADQNGVHELFMMCDDVEREMKSLQARGVTCSAVSDERWGSITRMTLPGGGKLGLYQPRHPTAFAKP